MEEENGQLQLDFPSPNDFPSFDEVPDDEAQAQLSDETYDGMTASDSEGGCCFGE